MEVSFGREGGGAVGNGAGKACPLAANENGRNAEHVVLLAQLGRHLAREVDLTGFVSASPRYKGYEPYWLRDGSWVAYSLCGLSKFIEGSRYDVGGLARGAADAAHRINGLNMRVILSRMPSIMRTNEIPYEDARHYELGAHVPARVDRSLGLYRGGSIDDQNNYNRWLVQHDSVPLALMAIEAEHRLSGLGQEQIRFLNENARDLARYMNKIALTPSSNAWEMETDCMHAYTLGALYSGKNVLGRLADAGVIRMDEQTEAVVRDNRAIMDMLRLHVDDGMMYRRRRPWNGPDKWAGVDAEQLFVFTRFGLGDAQLGEGVVGRTIERIERDLFSGNVLPIRNTQDVYFKGGRWLLLGLEYANYLAASGGGGRAREIVEYVLKRHARSMPEQEIVNPAHPESEEGRRDLEGNNGEAIQWLNWSCASAIDAIITLNTCNARAAGRRDLATSLRP